MARQLRSAADMLRSQGPLNRTIPLGDGFKVSLSLPGDVRLTPQVLHDAVPGQKFDKDGAVAVKCPDTPLYDEDGSLIESVPTKGKRTGPQLQAAIRHRYSISVAAESPEQAKERLDREMTAAGRNGN